MTRRELLKTTAMAGSFGICRSQEIQKIYFGNRLNIGLQTFSLRHLAFPQALQTMNRIGLSFFETFEDHLPTNTPAVDLFKLRRDLKNLSLGLAAYGVIGLDEGAPDRTQSLFNFAASMELYSISANPEPVPNVWKTLEKFVDETDIKIAIHPHGPEYSRYPGWKAIQKIIDGRHKNIGICMDVGHVTRNGENPVEGLLELSSRVYGVHLKDLDNQNKDTVLGKGKIDIRRILSTLEQIRYKGPVSLEFEAKDNTDPLPGIVESLEYIRQVLA